jgi:organic hydroperoxide reductase OsmC/OhrA
MTTHTALITWNRQGADYIDRKYSRAHQWRFDGGQVVPASSSPHVVRTPYSDPAAVDPEEAFVAALSSCHMLWFLDFAARAGYVVESYTDRAEGHMARREDGQEWVAKVILSPEVQFTGDKKPDEAAVRALHEAAHGSCFLAHSVRSEIIIRSGS